MLQRVIVAIDFSSASAAALAISRHHCPGATRRLLHVMKPADVARGSAAGAMAGAGSSPLHSKDMRQSAEEQAYARLKEWARDDEECAVAVGSAPEEISRLAEEWDGELIVMGTRGRSQLASMLSGSATEWLVRHASLPVMVVHDVPLSDAMREHLPPGFEHHKG
ncbi:MULTISPECIES: universal stress protein [unclassified Thioalkalivibrio]|uniref:universal stress protein n=1 Tax=unclassified Thioalkalivibrio TaxID=2621013 RepID=UPI00038128B5|nr:MULTISPECIES: universal stress protein [unclassified Thioalkalivibrio]PYG03445.1 nucleotide-binding universal stress UspA family protein [Thioalkalivibrio sp. ALE21]